MLWLLAAGWLVLAVVALVMDRLVAAGGAGLFALLSAVGASVLVWRRSRAEPPT